MIPKPIIDAKHILCEAMAITTNGDYDPAGTVDYFDLLADGDWGMGTPLFIYVWIDTVEPAGTETLEINIVDSVDASTWLDVNTVLPATDVNDIPCIDGKPDGGPGLILKSQIPPGCARYVSIRFTNSATCSALAVTAIVGP